MKPPRSRRAPRKVRRGAAFRGRPDAHTGLDVIIRYGNRDLGALVDGVVHGRVGNNRIVCRDGYTFSAIAGRGTLSWPRQAMFVDEMPLHPGLRPPTYRGPYTCLECDVPELKCPVAISVGVVRLLVAAHGGIHHLEGPHLRELREAIRLRAQLAPYLAGYRFVCPRCHKRSASPDDAANGYCGRCHDFTGARVDQVIVDDPVPPLPDEEARCPADTP